VFKACAACGVEYLPASPRQKNCAACSPTKGSRARLRRYGVSATDWAELAGRYDGMCWVCKKRPANCVDHDHQTGAVRGALCRPCNMVLGFMEDRGWIDEAQQYIAASTA
jgi:hypothetical protein